MEGVFWLAFYKTRQHEFVATGWSQAGAQEALIKALKAHAEQHGILSKTYREQDFSFFELTMGKGYRDAICIA